MTQPYERRKPSCRDFFYTSRGFLILVEDLFTLSHTSNVRGTLSLTLDVYCNINWLYLMGFMFMVREMGYI